MFLVIPKTSNQLMRTVTLVHFQFQKEANKEISEFLKPKKTKKNCKIDQNENS